MHLRGAVPITVIVQVYKPQALRWFRDHKQGIPASVFRSGHNICLREFPLSCKYQLFFSNVHFVHLEFCFKFRLRFSVSSSMLRPSFLGKQVTVLTTLLIKSLWCRLLIERRFGKGRSLHSQWSRERAKTQAERGLLEISEWGSRAALPGASSLLEEAQRDLHGQTGCLSPGVIHLAFLDRLGTRCLLPPCP